MHAAATSSTWEVASTPPNARSDLLDDGPVSMTASTSTWLSRRQPHNALDTVPSASSIC